MISYDNNYSTLGAVDDYDIITINGKLYSVNEVLDKTLVANGSTKVYSAAFDNATLKYTTPSGQSLGKVYSYLKPTAGRTGSWLMIQTGDNTFVYVPADSASPSALKEQGVKTVDEQVKEEEEAKQKEADPAGYYIKKYALPGVLIIGAIYAAVTFGKTIIEKKL